MARPTPGTQRGLDRLVFFSDTVVAITITLLILPLVDSVTKDKSLSDLLGDQGDQFVAFALSFVVIARFWIAHHSLFERADRYSMWLLRVNMLWLASIIFLPFPTELLSVQSTSETGVRFTYIASVLASSFFLLLVEIVIRRSPQLWAEGVAFEGSLAAASITVVLLVIALIVGTAVPAIGMWAMLFLFATGPLAALINRRTATPNG